MKPSALNTTEIPTLSQDLALQAIVIPAGAWDDPSGLSGLAHFTEHLVARCGSNSESGVPIERQAGRLGAWFDAYVTFERTVFSMQGLAEHFEEQQRLLMDTVFHFKPAQNDWALEKCVLEQQLIERQEQQYSSDDYLRFLLWGEPPLTRTIAGTLEALAKTSLNNLRQFWQAHYQPSTASLIICQPEGSGTPVSGKKSLLKVGSSPPKRRTPGPQQIAAARPDWSGFYVDLFWCVPPLKTLKQQWQLEIVGSVLESRVLNQLRHRSGLISSASAGGGAMPEEALSQR